VHCDVDGHASGTGPTNSNGVEHRGAITRGQFDATSPGDPSTVAGVTLVGADGLNVTSWPALSTAVHCVADGHATRAESPVMPRAIGEDHENRSALALAAPTMNTPTSTHSRAAKPITACGK
jgi:hypothetical protein